MPGSNLALFGWQSDTAPLRSAAIRTVPHGLGSTKSMSMCTCGFKFPGNHRYPAHFQHFAAQTQQSRAPRSASRSVARPARPMHTAHTHTHIRHMHQHIGTRIRAHAHSKHSNMHLAPKPSSAIPPPCKATLDAPAKGHRRGCTGLHCAALPCASLPPAPSSRRHCRICTAVNLYRK